MTKRQKQSVIFDESLNRNVSDKKRVGKPRANSTRQTTKEAFKRATQQSEVEHDETNEDHRLFLLVAVTDRLI